MDPNTIIVVITSVSRDYADIDTYRGYPTKVPIRFDFEVLPVETNAPLGYVLDAFDNGTKFKLVPVEE